MNKNKSIIITGAAGFIGSNLVKYFNKKGIDRIIIVDSINKINDNKILKKCNYKFSIDYKENKKKIKDRLKNIDIDIIFHIGANTNVLDTDLDNILKTNFDSSKFWYELSDIFNCGFIYASSSAVYGDSRDSSVIKNQINPLNEYALSKSLLDNYMQYNIQTNKINKKIIGFRFFNVFGLGENHKNKNASIPFRFFNFMLNDGIIEIFDENIQRDYVYVNDVVKVLFLAYLNNFSSGIYNLGSGEVISHMQIAEMVLAKTNLYNSISKFDNFSIIKIEMPKTLKNKFQFYTKALELESWIQIETQGSMDKMNNYIDNLFKEKLGQN